VQKPIANRLLEKLAKIRYELMNHASTIMSFEEGVKFADESVKQINNWGYELAKIEKELVSNLIKPMQTRIDNIQIFSCTSQSYRNDEQCITLLKSNKMLKEYYKESE